MNKLERCRKAKEYHDKGFNCAQSVLEASSRILPA